VANEEDEVRNKGSKIFYKCEMGVFWTFNHPIRVQNALLGWAWSLASEMGPVIGLVI